MNRRKTNTAQIIGITGAFGSGKSTAAEFFTAQGYKKVILSSFLEKEAQKRGSTYITRKILQDIGNEWRKKFGSGILAKKALAQIEKENIKKVIIDGIRNNGEIIELQKYSKFILLAIIANREIRFDRLKKLKRREKLTWDLFTQLDRRDLGLGQKLTGLRVADCIALADVYIDNNDLIEDFNHKLELFSKKL